MKIGDLVEYINCRFSVSERVGTIGIVSDKDTWSDPMVTVISPAWEMDDMGEELLVSSECWKVIGHAQL